MAQYRLLSSEELKALEKEFIEYLIVNGITADDWEKMKKEEKSHAERIVDLFSDVVFEGVMRKVQYLEYRQQKEIRTFQCLPDKVVLVGMKAKPQSKVDFTDPTFIQQAAVSPPDSLEVYTTEKNYTKKRELEIFEMTQSGCEVSDGQLFKQLCLSLPGLR